MPRRLSSTDLTGEKHSLESSRKEKPQDFATTGTLIDQKYMLMHPSHFRKDGPGLVRLDDTTFLFSQVRH